MIFAFRGQTPPPKCFDTHVEVALPPTVHQPSAWNDDVIAERIAPKTWGLEWAVERHGVFPLQCDKVHWRGVRAEVATACGSELQNIVEIRLSRQVHEPCRRHQLRQTRVEFHLTRRPIAHQKEASRYRGKRAPRNSGPAADSPVAFSRTAKRSQKQVVFVDRESPQM